MIEPAPGVAFRPLSAAYLPAAQRLTAQLGWPHRLEDWQLVARLGHGIVATDAADPVKVLGAALYWTYGADYASIGLVVVSPERQGAGIGRQLMARALQAVPGRHVMLNATEAGRPLYEKLGFVATGTVCQHQGVVAQAPVVVLPAGDRLRPIGAEHSALVARLASRASGMPRDHIVAALLEVGAGVAIERDGDLVAFALCRRFGRGHVIGPVVAPDADRARALTAHWIGQHANTFLRVDTPAASGISDWLVDVGIPRVDTGTSMVKGNPPREDPTARLFALVNQAMH